MNDSEGQESRREEKAPRRNRRLRKLARWLCVVLICGFVATNYLAYMQARAMTHFTSARPRTLPQQKLTRWQKAKLMITGVQIPRPMNLTDPGTLGLAFETTTFNSKDGLHLEAWHIPAEHPKGIVLIFHGFSASRSIMLDYVPPLHEMGYSVFMIDFRGSGTSGGNTTTLGLHEADDVAATVDYVRVHWPNQRLILYGQSMGSVAILRAISVHHVSPDSIIIECPYGSILRAVTNRFHSIGLPAHPLAELLVFWGGAPDGYWAFQLNAVEYAHAVTCAAMVMRGQNDRLVTESEARDVFGALGGAKQYVTIAHTEHESYAKANLVDWRKAVTAFLAGAK